MPTAFAAEPRAVSPTEHARVEVQVLLQQCGVALFFCAGVVAGLWGRADLVARLAAGYVGVYHALHAWYVLRFRVRGLRVAWVEALTPPLAVSCITVGWIALGDPASAFWAVYPFALVGYARRIHGRQFSLLTAFVVANLVGAKAWLAEMQGGSWVDGETASMIFITVSIGSMSNMIGSSWRNAEQQARRLAATDPLTGIANRRTFLHDLNVLASVRDSAFAILMLDLDDFKRLNDSLGHLHGDEVLAKVAQVLSTNIRAGDRLARYGGEEFVLALPQTDLHDARVMAERLRRAITESTPTTTSIGCAARLPGEPAESVLRRADDQLLEAKRQGKNAVWASEPLRKSA